jgi:hypothetical protein
MARTRKGKAIPEAAKVAPRCTLARLDELIEEATVDCYNESEQISGFYTMLEENLAVPFKTTLLGVEVVVEKLDLTNNDEIVAVCSRGDKCQRIPILELPLPRRAPAGSEWIDAYRRWAHWDRPSIWNGND